MTSTYNKHISFLGIIILFLSVLLLFGSAYGQGFGGGNNSSDRIAQEMETAKRLIKEKDYEEAESYLNRAAEGGNAEAQFLLGECYFNKKGSYNTPREMNIKKAFEWYHKAADQGHDGAREVIGNYYKTEETLLLIKKRSSNAKNDNSNSQTGNLSSANVANRANDPIKLFNEGLSAYKQEKYDIAFPAFRKAADLDHLDAMYYLGDCYDFGRGVRENDVEAVKWYRKAADKGNTDAMVRMGKCYSVGGGVEKDMNEANKWFRKAAENGNAIGMASLGLNYYLGDGVERDLNESIRWFRKSAELGNETAQKFLKQIEQRLESEAQRRPQNQSQSNVSTVNTGKSREEYFNEGVNAMNQKKIDDAIISFKKASEQGLPVAAFNIGVLYYKEKNNLPEAFQWFLKAAEQGNPDAQCIVGGVYSLGEGHPIGESLNIKIDIDEAKKWYQKAADQGDEDAKELLKNLEERERLARQAARGNSADPIWDWVESQR